MNPAIVCIGPRDLIDRWKRALAESHMTSARVVDAVLSHHHDILVQRIAVCGYIVPGTLTGIHTLRCSEANKAKMQAMARMMGVPVSNIIRGVMDVAASHAASQLAQTC